VPSCEWEEGCTDDATHTVTIAFPDSPTETWHVCRLHDRTLKNQAVWSRSAAPTPAEEISETEVHCGQCGAELSESANIPAANRGPCPSCGSYKRDFEVRFSATLHFHDCVRARKKTPGRGGWIVVSRTGDDYTHALGTWGTRELLTDRERDLYREVIVLHDGTRIESVAKLRDHRD
jgi:hypothetical protein